MRRVDGSRFKTLVVHPLEKVEAEEVILALVLAERIKGTARGEVSRSASPITTRNRGRRARFHGLPFASTLGLLVCTLPKPCAAWYDSPFYSRHEVQSALERCNNHGYGGTFENCRDGNDVHISDWDVRRVDDMSDLLDNSWQYYWINAQGFNADVSRWDVSSVTDMSEMFFDAHDFNGDISRWNTRSLEHMENTNVSMF